MRWHRFALAGLAALLISFAATAEDKTPSPLRLIAPQADVVVEIKSPRLLVESITKLDLAKELLTFAPVKEVVDSTQARRFFQLIAYYETALGAKWPELLDKIAGGGVALGAKIGDNAPAVLVVQGTDAKAMQSFKKLVLKVIEQELARQENPGRPVLEKYNEIETIRIGNAVHAAIVNSTLVVSNKAQGLKSALDLHKGKATKSMADHQGVANAKRILPKNSLATLWLNMKKVRENPNFDQITQTPRNPVFTVAFGDVADVVTRTPFLAVGYAPTDDGLMLTARMPRGREGMGPEKAIFIPAAEDPLRPSLYPKGTIFSASFYWDVSQFWTQRKELFGDMVAKQFEEADKQAAKLPINVQPSKILQMFGGHHRIVVAHHTESGYKKKPDQDIPAFAIVTEPKDVKEFYKTVDPLVRGGAFLLTTQFGLKLVETEHDGVKIVGYRFPENKELAGDTGNVRFAFSPCYFQVEKQFVVCSKLEFAGSMIDEIRAKAKMEPKKSSAASRHHINSGGVVQLLKEGEDQFITQTILDQGVPFAEAKKQVQDLFKVLRKTGGVSFGQVTTDKQFQYNLRFILTKKK